MELSKMMLALPRSVKAGVDPVSFTVLGEDKEAFLPEFPQGCYG